MTPKALAKEVSRNIHHWAQEHERIVVAIDGYTGIGKTTLVDELASLESDILAVSRDDFMLSRKVVAMKLAEAEDRSRVWELDACDNDKLYEFVSVFKKGTRSSYQVDTYDSVSGEITVPKVFDFTKKIMVVEGVFMFHSQFSPSILWDKRIYLKGKLATIDARRIKREKEKWGKDYFPETHPDSYLRHIIVGLKRYIKLYEPDKIADLVFNVD